MADTSPSPRLDAAKLSHIEGILKDFKEDARKAEQEQDLFMLSIYNRLLKVMSPIVTNAYERIERDDKAAVNKAERLLRRQRREAVGAQKHAPEEQ